MITRNQLNSKTASPKRPSKPSLPAKTFNILIGVTGSVATIKLIELIQRIKSLFPRPYAPRPGGPMVEAKVALRIVMTQHSQHFTSKRQIIESVKDPSISIYDDHDEWSSWSKMADPVLHIELRKWADLFLIAPLSANSMGKISNGICDNLLTCIVRAWDISKPLIYCPAMNVHMYNHPVTRDHLSKLQSFGYLRVDSVEKRLACGDVGMGAMAALETISDKLVDTLFTPASSKATLSLIRKSSDNKNDMIGAQLSKQRFVSNGIKIPAEAPNSAALAVEPVNSASYDGGIVPDFDPSNLLEQSMVIDEPRPTPISASGVDTNSEPDTKTNGISPLFNTSKFLALCHNKERGCFTCKICKHDYKNRKSMARHLKEQHVQGSIYHCGVCGVSYKRREKLMKHNRERHLMDHNSLSHKKPVISLGRTSTLADVVEGLRANIYSSTNSFPK